MCAPKAKKVREQVDATLASHRLARQHDDVKLLIHALSALAQLLQLVAIPTTNKGPAVALEAGAVPVAVRQGCALQQARPAVLWLGGGQDGRGAGLVVA
ncbi:hypothetical protein OPT61_g10731 [Boeremia exigua]|uniref:Uncharacterized protein n=1 Tax=Boeremia exigua TaxID=749465 RepID=A0ACC2HN93_9PLEO|nr:hypothetical protein OPT61_g10731 [Boeremia exigua]